MMMVIPLALGLIVAGLLMCWLHGSVRGPGLQSVVYWSGIVVVILGLVLLLFPVLAWLHRNLIAMFGL